MHMFTYICTACTNLTLKLIVGGVGVMYIQSKPGTAHNWLMV